MPADRPRDASMIGPAAGGRDGGGRTRAVLSPAPAGHDRALPLGEIGGDARARAGLALSSAAACASADGVRADSTGMMVGHAGGAVGRRVLSNPALDTGSSESQILPQRYRRCAR